MKLPFTGVISNVVVVVAAVDVVAVVVAIVVVLQRLARRWFTIKVHEGVDEDVLHRL